MIPAFHHTVKCVCVCVRVSYILGWSQTAYGVQDSLELLIFLSPNPKCRTYNLFLKIKTPSQFNIVFTLNYWGGIANHFRVMEVYYLCFAVLGNKPRALHILGQCSTTELHPCSYFIFWNRVSLCCIKLMVCLSQPPR